MQLEQLISVYTLLLNLAALMVCLFQYVSKPKKIWSNAISFFLANLLSNYYWCVYILVMGSYPNVSSLLAYFGWNAAFLILPFILFNSRYKEEKGFFSLLSLIPVPINIIQFMIYIQFGGLFNNIWQGGLATLSACMSLNSIVYYYKNKNNGALRPYVSFAVFLYIISEYVMWTASCYSFPSEWLNPYNYASLVSGVCYILIPFSIIRMYRELRDDKVNTSAYLEKVIKPVYAGVIVLCCIAGYVIALWMRYILLTATDESGRSDPFSVIAVMLFFVSVVIVLFSLTIILLVNVEGKSAESRFLKEEKVTAERSNAAKSDFLANMSHEIRTPLNAILGMNEIILMDSLKGRDELPGEREDIRNIFSDICNYSGNIESAGNNLLYIINDILDLSKIEAGKMDIINADYKLSSVVNDVVIMMDFKARSKGLDFKVFVEPSIPDTLRGDEVRIRQVITNILNNAVKYTIKGSISFAVTFERHVNEEGEKTIDLIFSVKDTGIGIKEEDIERLFNKFERMELEKNSNIEGAGLGLTITKSLIDLMDGTISVNSIYGSGSEFMVTLPQRVVSDEAIGNLHEKFEKSINERKVEKEQLHAPRAHILVVDDTSVNLLVVKGLLKNTGIRIDTAESGQESILLCAENKYDIIFMDQRMPGMDGVTAMHGIREEKKGLNADTPFICLTADAVSGAKERYISWGFDDYLTKPIDNGALKKMVMKYLPGEKTEKVLTNNKEEAAISGNKDITALPENKEEAAISENNDKTASPENKEEEASRENKDIVTPSIDKDIWDRNLGLIYSGGDADLYREILSDYVSNSETRIPELERLYKEKEWKDYGILVHALKSSSKMIGMTKLSKMAAGLEKAADSFDEAFIGREHGDMIALYKEVIALLNSEDDLI